MSDDAPAPETARLIRRRVVARLGFSAASFAVCLSFVGNYLAGSSASGESLSVAAVASFVAAVSAMLALSLLYVWLASRHLDKDGSEGADGARDAGEAAAPDDA